MQSLSKSQEEQQFSETISTRIAEMQQNITVTMLSAIAAGSTSRKVTNNHDGVMVSSFRSEMGKCAAIQKLIITLA